MSAATLEINLSKIHHNTKKLLEMWQEYGVEVMGVTKVLMGEPRIVSVMVEAGIHMIGDSRLESIIKMRESHINGTYVLIRTPCLSDVTQVVAYVDISFNTELSVIKALSQVAIETNKNHRIVLMVEMGDRREGVLPENLHKTVEKVLQLKGIILEGIGANFACFGGVVPTQEKMDHLSLLAKKIEKMFGIKLSMVSGGNSANYAWLHNHTSIGRINNIRIGESIFMGVETLCGKPISDLYQDAFLLKGEVIEYKEKPSLPHGETALNAFGIVPRFEDRGKIFRAIISMGRADVDIDGLTATTDVDIIGGSSDHLILDAKKSGLMVGDYVTFKLNYSALLSAMSAPFVTKVFKKIL